MSERGSRRKNRRHRNPGSGLESRGESICFWLATLIASGTVAVSPWFLGGAIPHAQLILQCGAVASSLFCLAGCLTGGHVPQRLPGIMWCFLGLSGLALLQLAPVFSHPALSMDGAVFGELAPQLPALTGELAGQRVARTPMPGETWLVLNQFLTMALFSIVFVVTSGPVSRMVVAPAMLVTSGVVMTVMGLSQQLGSAEVIVGNDWKISPSPPFGCFVNPNNAAGWLMICMSAAFLCSGVAFGKTPDKPALPTRKMRWRERSGLAIGTFARQIGGMTPIQTAACLSCVLLLGGIAGTLSRAGIAAGCVGAVGFFASRIRTERWILAIWGMLLMLVLASGFLLLLDLDTPILTELSTLKDPVSASTIRVVHWTDTVWSILDFPLLGSGLGAYSYATLPYQRHFTGWWFEHADNQYFEVLVEAGLVGFLLFAAIAAIGCRSALRLILPREDTGIFVRRRYADWVGSAIFCMLLALSGQVFFDFSVSLPSVLAAFVMMLAIQHRRMQEVRRLAEESVQDDNEQRQPGRYGQLVVPGIWCIVVVGNLLLVPDTLDAIASYEAYAPARRVLDRPHPDVLAESGDAMLKALDDAMARRPIDAGVQRVRVQLMRLMAQHELYVASTAGTEVKPADKRNQLGKVEATEYAIRYLALKEPDKSGTMLEPFLAAVSKYPWREESRKLLAASAFVPSLASELYAGDQFFPPETDEDRILQHVFFSEPHAARRLTALGHCLILANREQEGLLCWQQSIADSEKFRADILRIGADFFGLEAMLDRFPPETFESSAGAAISLPDGELRTRLLGIAEAYWTAGGFHQRQSLLLLRADQLDLMRRPQEAFTLLREALDNDPSDCVLRRKLAALLEKNGLNEEAYNEWMRIDELDPGQEDSQTSLKRLIKLPPTRLD
ncbi:MAG: O-antigen ligase family protein [Planctomycetia bacterium]